MLEEGARFPAPVCDISPFNDAAALPGLEQWQHFNAPTRDFGEMMFNITPLCRRRGQHTGSYS